MLALNVLRVEVPQAEGGQERAEVSKPDVTSEQDIRLVVDAFYGDIDRDPLLGTYFAGIDMGAHLALSGLSADHFARWIDRFCRTVDARFESEHADRMKARARQITGVFQHKMDLLGTS